MKMRNLTLGIIAMVMIVIGISAIAPAQQDQKSNKTPEEIATKKADRLKSALALTDEQYKQVYSVFLENANKMKTEREKMKSLDKEARKEIKKKHKEETRAKLQGILTKDQMDKLEQMKGGKRKSGKGNRP